ncbi:MAG: NAD(P)-dependent oxidoreductase, partial [Achromobacter sp.]
PEPKDRRMMVTWLSYDDLTDLVTRALFTPDVGHLIVYGASANRDRWWSDDAARVLGFVPKDSSERYRAQVEAQAPLPADDPAARYQGGAFVKAGPFPFPAE